MEQAQYPWGGGGGGGVEGLGYCQLGPGKLQCRHTHSKLHRQLFKILNVLRKEELSLAMFDGVHLVPACLQEVEMDDGDDGGRCGGCVCVCTCSFLCSSLNTADWFTTMVTSGRDATLSEFWKQEREG